MAVTAWVGRAFVATILPMRFLLPAVLFGLAAAAAPAYAETTVTGEPTDVTVEASGATLREVVDAVAGETGMTINLEGSEEMPVDGKFEGAVEEVLARILRNMSFVISALDDKSGLRIHVLGEGVAATAPPPSMEAGVFDPMQQPAQPPPDQTILVPDL